MKSDSDHVCSQCSLQPGEPDRFQPLAGNAELSSFLLLYLHSTVTWGNLSTKVGTLFY